MRESIQEELKCINKEHLCKLQATDPSVEDPTNHEILMNGCRKVRLLTRMYTMPFLGTYSCILEGKHVHFRREHEVLKEPCHDSFKKLENILEAKKSQT